MDPHPIRLGAYIDPVSGVFALQAAIAAAIGALIHGRRRLVWFWRRLRGGAAAEGGGQSGGGGEV